ncbi:nodulation protein NodH [Oceaniglobus ichthyenteri]|uniref:nodulation protein NodH n=1 Tax=Oceaniglobus ichthyenteri TaxID=2136177 RepID=UPI000D38529A|nr:nodulation protein NodH [Oceaniglobus ichthyenteri]
MARFDSFILLAEMRTGSNFLEDTLNSVTGLKCWGEAFNPHFISHAGKTEQAGITIAAREADPLQLLRAIRDKTEGIAGFRFFHDHDPRILSHCLTESRCAKVVLTRNPLDSYVSLEIARLTGQWRLGDLKAAKTAKITFDPVGFSRHLSKLQGFQQDLTRHLQVSGQTAFYIRYDDINDVEILNGLLAYLGVSDRLDGTSGKTKVQNPSPLRDKVLNYDDMVAHLAGHDHFDLGRTPNFEQRRGPNIPGFIFAAQSPLVYLPIRGGAMARVESWFARLDGAPAVTPEMTQKDLRKWKRKNPDHRSFTVIEHPVARIHDTFARHIWPVDQDGYGDLRTTLRDRYNVPLPDDGVGETPAYRAAFLAFLKFVKGNLGGQTSIRNDPAWATQSGLVQGMAQFMSPDMIIRDTQLSQGLSAVSGQIGMSAPDAPEPELGLLPEIYDSEIEAAVRDVYQRDYMMFGYRTWGDQAHAA